MKTKILILSYFICFYAFSCFAQRTQELKDYFYTDEYLEPPYKLQAKQPKLNLNEATAWEDSQWEMMQEAVFRQIIENMSDTTFAISFESGEEIDISVPKDTAFFHTLYDLNRELRGFASAASMYYYYVAYREATDPNSPSSMGRDFYENIHAYKRDIMKYSVLLNIFILNLKYILNEL